MDLRLCKQCRFVKPVDHFYVSNQTKCKECVKAAVRKNRSDNIEHYRQFDRDRNMLAHRVEARTAYAQTDAGKAAHIIACKRWDALNVKRKRAQGLVGKAILRGKMQSQPCFICGEKAHAHHPDYDRPLDVVWLCPAHHKQAHKETEAA